MPSFDIVCKTNVEEVDNALNSLKKEIGQRYDFKGSKSSVERKDNAITLLADDDYKLKAVQQMLKAHIARRGVNAKSLVFQKEEKAAGSMLRQQIDIRQGIDQDTAKAIVKKIKDQKMKVQASIRGDELRVTGNKRDDLQAVIQLLRADESQETPLQFVNLRD